MIGLRWRRWTYRSVKTPRSSTEILPSIMSQHGFRGYQSVLALIFYSLFTNVQRPMLMNSAVMVLQVGGSQIRPVKPSLRRCSPDRQCGKFGDVKESRRRTCPANSRTDIPISGLSSTLLIESLVDGPAPTIRPEKVVKLLNGSLGRGSSIRLPWAAGWSIWAQSTVHPLFGDPFRLWKVFKLSNGSQTRSPSGINPKRWAAKCRPQYFRAKSLSRERFLLSISPQDDPFLFATIIIYSEEIVWIHTLV